MSLPHCRAAASNCASRAFRFLWTTISFIGASFIRARAGEQGAWRSDFKAMTLKAIFHLIQGIAIQTICLRDWLSGIPADRHDLRVVSVSLRDDHAGAEVGR